MHNSSRRYAAPAYLGNSAPSGPVLGWGAGIDISPDTDNSSIMGIIPSSMLGEGHPYPPKNIGCSPDASHSFDPGRDTNSAFHIYNTGAQVVPTFEAGATHRHYNFDPNIRNFPHFHPPLAPNPKAGSPFQPQQSFDPSLNPTNSLLTLHTDHSLALSPHFRHNVNLVSHTSVGHTPQSQGWMNALDGMISTNQLPQYHQGSTTQENPKPGRKYILGPRISFSLNEQNQRDQMNGRQTFDAGAYLVPDNRPGKGTVVRHQPELGRGTDGFNRHTETNTLIQPSRPRPLPFSKAATSLRDRRPLSVSISPPHIRHPEAIPLPRHGHQASHDSSRSPTLVTSSRTSPIQSPSYWLSFDSSSSPPYATSLEEVNVLEDQSSEGDPLDCLGHDKIGDPDGRNGAGHATDSEQPTTTRRPVKRGNAERRTSQRMLEEEVFDGDGFEDDGDMYGKQESRDEYAGGGESSGTSHGETYHGEKKRAIKRARPQGDAEDGNRYEDEYEGPSGRKPSAKKARGRGGREETTKGKGSKEEMMKGKGNKDELKGKGSTEGRPWPTELYNKLVDTPLSQVLPPNDPTTRVRLECMMNMLVIEKANLIYAAESLLELAERCDKTHNLRGDAIVAHITSMMRFSSKLVAISRNYEVRHNNAPSHLLKRMLSNSYAGRREVWYSEGLKWLFIAGSGTTVFVPVCVLTGKIQTIKTANLEDIKMVCLAIRQAETPLIRECFLPMIHAVLDSYPLEMSLFVAEQLLDDPSMKCDEWGRLDAILQMQLIRRYKVIERPRSWTVPVKSRLPQSQDRGMVDLRYRFLPHRSGEGPPKWTLLVTTDFIYSELQSHVHPTSSMEIARDLEAVRAKARGYDILTVPALLIDLFSRRQADLTRRAVQGGYMSFHTKLLASQTLVVADMNNRPLFSIVSDMPSSIRDTLLASAKQLALAARDQVSLTDTHARIYELLEDDDTEPSEPTIRIGAPTGTRVAGQVPYTKFKEAFKPFISWYEQRRVEEENTFCLLRYPSLTDLSMVFNCAPGPRPGRGFLVISDVRVALIVSETGVVCHANNGDFFPVHTDKINIAFQHLTGHVAILALGIHHSP